MGGDIIEASNQMCKRCVMDTTDPDIVFDENGICNHCREYFEKEHKCVIKGKKGEEKVRALVNKIKEAGKGKDYDCILGISGGADSSYVAYLAKTLGLRVLLVHLDNGWNTEVADKNVENIIRNTGFDVYKYEVEWKEIKDLQLAFLKASVINIEMVTDHAITAALYDVANKKRIKYILSGINFVTEKIMPTSWGHRYNDLPNLKGIHKKFGTVKLETYPTMSLFKRVYYRIFKGIQVIPLLDYVGYNKKEAKEVLHREFGWDDYGGKHYESIFTKFYQAYILPAKFDVDKRKAHLSSLICSGQITREEALKELKKPLYNKEELEQDKNYVLKKLGLSEKEFEDLMKLPIKKHQEYGTDEWIYLLLKGLRDLHNALKV